MATHSSTLAWKIPRTEEPGGLQSMRSLRVKHNWVTSLSLFTVIHWRRKWQPTPVFLVGESQGRGSLVGCCLWGLHRVGHDWSDLAAAAVVSNSLPPHGLYTPGHSPGQNTGVGSLSLLQGIVPTQGSNPGLSHCRWILYQLSHKGSSDPKNSWQRTSALRQKKHLIWGGVAWQPWVLSIKYFQSFFTPYGRICFCTLEVMCGVWFLWTVKSDACDNPWKSHK